MLSVRNGRMSCCQQHSQKVSWEGTVGWCQWVPSLSCLPSTWGLRGVKWLLVYTPGCTGGRLATVWFCWWWGRSRSHHAGDALSSALVLVWAPFFFIKSPHSLAPSDSSTHARNPCLFYRWESELRKQNCFTSFILHKESLCRCDQCHVWFNWSCRPQYDTYELVVVCVTLKILLRNISL